MSNALAFQLHADFVRDTLSSCFRHDLPWRILLDIGRFRCKPRSVSYLMIQAALTTKHDITLLDQESQKSVIESSANHEPLLQE
jgi:hypothetical protein